MKGIFCDERELIELRLAMRPLRLPYGRKMAATGSGIMQSRVRGRGVDFSEVRKYVPGDDSRTIDWRVTARRGRVHTKVFTEERERPVYFVVDQTKSMFFGTTQAFKSVTAARACAQVAWGAQAFGDRVGAIVFSDDTHAQHNPKPGKRGALALIRLLTGFTKALYDQRETSEHADGRLSYGLERLCRIAPKGGIVVIASDFSESDLNQTKRWLSLLSRHNDVLGFHVYDKLERVLPQGSFAFSNRQEILSLDLSKQDTAAFETAFVEHSQQLQELFRSVGGSLFELSTDANLTDWMITTFGTYAARHRRSR